MERSVGGRGGGGAQGILNDNWDCLSRQLELSKEPFYFLMMGYYYR